MAAVNDQPEHDRVKLTCDEVCALLELDASIEHQGETLEMMVDRSWMDRP